MKRHKYAHLITNVGPPCSLIYVRALIGQIDSNTTTIGTRQLGPAYQVPLIKSRLSGTAY